MKTRARTAFTLTATSCLAFFIGWVIPFWFGRWYEESRSKKQWGLFYEIQCKPGNCTNVAGILRKHNVDFGGADSPIELEAIAVLATLAFAMSLLGLMTVLIFHCHVCGKAYSYHSYVIGAAIIQLTTALLALVTIILEAICLGFFFKNVSFDSVIEFPWSLLCYCIGEVLVLSSAFIFVLISYKWKQHRRVYARYRYPIENKPHGPEPPPDYDRNQDGRYKSYDNESFVGYYRDSSGDRYHRSSSREQLPRQDIAPARDYHMYRPYYTLPGRRSGNLLVTDNRVYSGANYFPYATVRRDYGGPPRTMDDGPRRNRIWHTPGEWDDPVAMGYDIRGADVIM